jgi:hypothetical protein
MIFLILLMITRGSNSIVVAEFDSIAEVTAAANSMAEFVLGLSAADVVAASLPPIKTTAAI